MALETEYLKLSKAEETDKILTTLQANNNNFDVIDGKIKELDGKNVEKEVLEIMNNASTIVYNFTIPVQYKEVLDNWHITMTPTDGSEAKTETMRYWLDTLFDYSHDMIAGTISHTEVLTEYQKYTFSWDSYTAKDGTVFSNFGQLPLLTNYGSMFWKEFSLKFWANGARGLNAELRCGNYAIYFRTLPTGARMSNVGFSDSSTASLELVDRYNEPTVTEGEPIALSLLLHLYSYYSNKIVNIHAPVTATNPTLNINNLGAKTINGTIEQGKNYSLVYNGTSWDILVNEGGNSGESSGGECNIRKLTGTQENPIDFRNLFDGIGNENDGWYENNKSGQVILSGYVLTEEGVTKSISEITAEVFESCDEILVDYIYGYVLGFPSIVFMWDYKLGYAIFTCIIGMVFALEENNTYSTTKYVDDQFDTKITCGTTDLTAGTSELATGTVYFVYE